MGEQTTITAAAESTSATADVAGQTMIPGMEGMIADAAKNLPEPSKLVDLPEPGAFDPAIHAVDGEGKPRRNLDGSFSLKGGRGAPSHQAKFLKGKGGKFVKKGKPSEISRGGPEASVQNAPPAPPIGPSLARLSTARMYVTIYFSTLNSFLHPEWEPVKDGVYDEKEEIAQPLAAWMEANDVNDLPPVATLLLVLAMTVVRRAAMPKTKAALASAFAALPLPWRKPSPDPAFAETPTLASQVGAA